ncbi:MAG: response regulator [Chitinivibrionales bacterium]|nr:response regulator [Chitinivibrionales bacterium]
MKDVNKTILLVDDDVAFVHSVIDLLEAEGYRILSAHNGTDGMALAKKEKPDLVMLDVMMDYNTEGFEVSRELKKHCSLNAVPVVLVTGICREMNLPFRFEADDKFLPVNKIVEKPVAPKKLLELVATLLNNDTPTHQHTKGGCHE